MGSWSPRVCKQHSEIRDDTSCPHLVHFVAVEGSDLPALDVRHQFLLCVSVLPELLEVQLSVGDGAVFVATNTDEQFPIRPGVFMPGWLDGFLCQSGSSVHLPSLFQEPGP